jgi:hypothetical protein
MFKLAKLARSVLNCALMMALAAPLATYAAVAAAPAKPPAAKHLPYQAPNQSDVASAYEYRTRLAGTPACQRFATESDAVFLDDKIAADTKVTVLQKIGAEAGAAGCLGPKSY